MFRATLFDGSELDTAQATQTQGIRSTRRTLLKARQLALTGDMCSSAVGRPWRQTRGSQKAVFCRRAGTPAAPPSRAPEDMAARHLSTNTAILN